MKWLLTVFIILLPMPAIAGVQMFFNGSEFRLNTNRANVIVRPRCIDGLCNPQPFVGVNVYPYAGYYYAPYYAPYYGRPYYAPPVILYRR